MPRCYAGGEQLRAAITKLGMPYTVVTLFERPARLPVAQLATTATRLVIAEAVDNPVNIGSIVRNSLALGWDGLVVDRTSADPLARRALRVSMGHALRLPHARTHDVPALVRPRSLPTAWWCARSRQRPMPSTSPTYRGRPHGAAGGLERAGLSPAAMAAATHRVTIPMQPASTRSTRPRPPPWPAGSCAHAEQRSYGRLVLIGRPVSLRRCSAAGTK